MPPRKKNAESKRPTGPRSTAPKPPCAFDIDALLVIGEEQVVIDHEENDNIAFMAELIDTE